MVIVMGGDWWFQAQVIVINKTRPEFNYYNPDIADPLMSQSTNKTAQSFWVELQ